jgi:hypothetical protein
VFTGGTGSLDHGLGTVTSGTPVATGNLAATTTYGLTVTNTAGDSATASATVTVGPAVAITGFAAAKSPLTAGSSTTLTATFSDATGAAVDQGVGAVASGTPVTVTPGSTTTYTLTATGLGGPVTRTVTVTVVPAPAITSFTASPGSVAAGNGSQLTAVFTGGTGALDHGLGSITSGVPVATGNLAATTTYGLTVTNAAGDGATASATVSVVLPPGPVIGTQPRTQIIAAGSPVSFSVAASGSGPLTCQWYRNGAVVPGATGTTYTLPAVAAGDDGAVFTAVVTDAYSSTAASDPATLVLFQDLATWLGAHPTLASAIKWQFQPANLSNVYTPPTDTDKVAWPDWTPGQQADLDQAYRDAVAWFNQGASQAAMIGGGPGITDEPVNNYPSVSSDSTSTMEWVSPAYMWQLYTGHAAFQLMLEAARQVPWSVAGDSAESLKWLFDSATMGWYLANGNYSMGTYAGAGLPALRTDNRPQTSFADPRWTYPWLRQAGLLGTSRQATLGKVMDWMRANMWHFFGADSFGTDAAVWQYRGWPPLSRIVAGTVDSRYPDQGSQHWTEGCHGSVGFLHAVLRAVNIPVQPVWVCGHELAWFPSEDLYLDHGDDPYNAVVRGDPEHSTLLLLIDGATYASRFGADATVNLPDPYGPGCAWVGYAAAHFP